MLKSTSKDCFIRSSRSSGVGLRSGIGRALRKSMEAASIPSQPHGCSIPSSMELRSIVRRTVMRASRVVIATSSVAFCALLGATTPSEASTPSTFANVDKIKQQQQHYYEYALDADGD